MGSIPVGGATSGLQNLLQTAFLKNSKQLFIWYINEGNNERIYLLAF